MRVERTVPDTALTPGMSYHVALLTTARTNVLGYNLMYSTEARPLYLDFLAANETGALPNATLASPDASQSWLLAFYLVVSTDGVAPTTPPTTQPATTAPGASTTQPGGSTTQPGGATTTPGATTAPTGSTTQPSATTTQPGGTTTQPPTTKPTSSAPLASLGALAALGAAALLLL